MFLPSESSQFDKRQTTCQRRDAYGRCVRTSSSYGRWIAMSVVLFVFFAFLLCCLSLSARRRRKGAMPLYGTRWIIRPGPQGANQHHQNPQHAPAHNQNPGMVQSPGAWPPTHNGQYPPNNNGQNPNWLPSYTPGNYQQGYAPPAGPPPSGPSNQEYFPPPSNPPPAHHNTKY